jgi:hypothetical protein
MDDANLQAAVKVLTGRQLHAIMDAVVRQYGFTEADIRAKFSVYNNWPASRLEEAFCDEQ